jgi:hypothetical protein
MGCGLSGQVRRTRPAPAFNPIPPVPCSLAFNTRGVKEQSGKDEGRLTSAIQFDVK